MSNKGNIKLIAMWVLGIGFVMQCFSVCLLKCVAQDMPSSLANKLYVTRYKRSVSDLNSALLQGMAMTDATYTNPDNIWYKEIKPNLNLSNETEIKYLKLRDKCVEKSNTSATRANACALLTVDVNGFAKAPNRRSTVSSIADRYNLLLYQNTIVPISGSDEAKILVFPKAN